ncbi:MAG TPA: hypothetical protein GXX46_12645 [Peptococcaceae bacterium]|nr:hypothetical protein [Peptococcaceae bacterium]
MGTSILKGITIGLLVTVLTLLTVLVTTLAGFSENIISYIVDFGLLLSCLAAGYRSSRASGRILPAGLSSGGYAVVGVLLLALYFPIDILGAVKIISEGIGLGLLAGVLGTGILSSEPDPYDRLGAAYYPRRENVYDRQDIYQVLQDRGRERSDLASVSYREEDIPEFRPETVPFASDNDLARAKIYEICNRSQEKSEEEDAFEWWNIETRRQLKGR